MHLDLKTMPQLGLRAPAAAQVLVVSLVRLFRTLEQVVLEEAMIKTSRQKHLLETAKDDVASAKKIINELTARLYRTNKQVNMNTYLI